MISQNLPEKQELRTNITEIFSRVPAVFLRDDGNRAYILVKDLSEEMTEYISSGKVTTSELHVFSEGYERELIRKWRSMGFEFGYRSQRLEYIGRDVTVKYLEVSNPQTGIKISLIPWFLAPGRPFPIFVYLYAVWHYNNSEQKSMQLSVMATRKLFRISNFSKSTLSRTIKFMEPLLSSFQMNSPLPAEEPEIPSAAETINCISELLKNCQSIEAIEKATGIKAVCLSPPIRRKNNVSYALSLIPNELSNVIKEKKPGPEKGSDSRKRPARPRKRPQERPPVQHVPDYVEFHERERIRRAFIHLCEAIVLNAAVSYHRFLI